MGDVPKPKRYLFNFEELTILIVIGILFCLILLPHWLDPSFNTFTWFSAKVNNKPLPPFHPRWLMFKAQTIQILLMILRLASIVLFFVSIYLGWRYYWRQQQSKSMKTYKIILSRDDTSIPMNVTAFFDTFSETLSKRYTRLIFGNDPMSLAFYRQPDKEIVLLLRIKEEYFASFESQIRTTWTSVRLEPYTEKLIFPNESFVGIVRPTKRTDLNGFKNYRDYNKSITEDILSHLDKLEDTAFFDISLKPIPKSYGNGVRRRIRDHQRALNANAQVDESDPTLSMGDQAQLQAVVKAIGRSWWRMEIRIVAPTLMNLQSMTGVLAATNDENEWRYHRVWVRKQWILNLMESGMPGFEPFIKRFLLNSTFIATIWQLPSARLRAKGLTRSSVRRGPGTVGLARNESGCTPVQDDDSPVIIPEGDRKQGIITVGQQGTGKSTILEQVAWNDFRQDKATIVIDPKFRMAERLRGMLPDDKKVAIWQVGNKNISWGWNPFMQSQIDQDLIVAGVLDGMKQVWGKDGIGPRSTDYLRYTMAATLATSQADKGFLSVEELLREPRLWEPISQRLPSPINNWFRTMASKYEDNARLIVESTDAPLNKLSALTFSDKMRHSLSTGNSLDIRQVIRDKGILIISLEADRIGNESANLIGTFLVAAIWEALKREGVLNPATTSIIIDEAHRMVCPSFANMLAEGRSYGAQASVGLQFLGQIPDIIVKDSIDELLQNMFLFRSNQVEETESYMKLFSRVYTNMIQSDAEIQDKLLFGPDDRFNLPNYHALCRIVVNGNPKPAFLGTTIPLSPDPKVTEKHPWGECPEEWLIRANPNTETKPIEISAQEDEREEEASEQVAQNTNDAEPETTKDDLEDLVMQAIILADLNRNNFTISLLQRRLEIGYSKAARIMEKLEERGIVGPHKGSKPRDILIPKDDQKDKEVDVSPEVIGNENETAEAETPKEEPVLDVKTDPLEKNIIAQNVTNTVNENPLADIGITDEQIKYLKESFSEAIVSLAIKRTQKKVEKETIAHPYAYLTKSCQSIKRSEAKKENAT